MSERNPNPTPEVIVAMTIRGNEHGPQRLGCMDRFDTLLEPRKRETRDFADTIIAAEARHRRLEGAIP